jgi:DNA-binding NarL/FixJ family response regulator
LSGPGPIIVDATRMMEQEVRILVADPQPLVAEGLRSWLGASTGYRMVGHVADGRDLAGALSAMPCDLVLLEVSLPGMDGIDAMRMLHRDHPGLPVLAHSGLADIEYVNSMLIEGARGYLVKGGGPDELFEAIDSVLSGSRYQSPAAQRSTREGYAWTTKRPDGKYIGLTQREREIIRLIALERTNGEIAAALFISEDTVKTHRKNLMTKLNVRSSAGLVKYAMDRRWV